MDFVDKTTYTLQSKIPNTSDVSDDSEEDNKAAKQKLVILKKNDYFDLSTFKPNLEECTLKIKNLKIENNISLVKLNEATAELSTVKETVLNLNQHFEKEFKDMDNQNLLHVNQNYSMYVNYDEMLKTNQSLKNECHEIKTSLSLYKNLLNVQSKLIEERSYNLMENNKLNETLTKDLIILKKINDYLKERNYSLMHDFSKNKLFQDVIQKENECKFNEMCRNGDDLLNMLEEKLLNPNKKLALQKEIANKIPNEDNMSSNELNDQYVPICNESLDCSSLKRNSSPFKDIGNSSIKKRKTSFEITTYEENINCNQNLKTSDKLKIDSNLTSNPLKEKFNKCIKLKNKGHLESIAGSTTAVKKLFKIPDDIKHERKLRLVNISKDDKWSKPNSLVSL